VHPTAITSEFEFKLDVGSDMELRYNRIRVPRFFAESPPSLLLGLCARIPSSLCRGSGLGWVLGFRRVFVESFARVACLVSAESLQKLWTTP
jgi:hypothetical protein